MTTKPPETNDNTLARDELTCTRDDATRVHSDDKTLIKPIDDDKTKIAPSDDDATRINKTPDATRVNPIAPSTATVHRNTDSTQTRNPLTNTLHNPFKQGGDVINGRFIIEKILGQGGMGMVCKALDLRKVEADDQQPYVAIKLLSGAFEQHPNAFKTLQREAKKSQALAHPNIITVFDFDRDDDTIFMTMEILDGYPLDAIIRGTTDIDLSRKDALRIIREIGNALAYAHSKGIIHSDLKPANIFYTKSGQTKVLDFGIARALNSELYSDNFDAGELNAITPKYASLEMFEHQPPDPRDDIYALGLIAGELLCGKHPYYGNYATVVKAKHIKPEVDKSLGYLYKQLIINAVAVERENRTQSAAKFLSRLTWAEKGPKRFLITLLIVISLAAANSFLINAVDDDIPLSELPQATQVLVTNNIKEADTALSFDDDSGALAYLERAYELHPSNHDVRDRIEKILTKIQDNINATQDPAEKTFLIQQLLDIGSYQCLARNESYMALVKQYQ